MVSDPLLVALSLALVLLNAFFTAGELAMVRVRATRIEALAEEGHWQARLVRSIQRRPDAFLSATQLGITLTSLALGWIGEPAFAHLLAGAFAALGIESQRALHNAAFVLAFATITFLHIVIGELAPKSYAIRFTERVALWVALPMRIFQIVFSPALWLLQRAASATLKLFGVTAETSGDLAHSEE
jgi:CBS domain containing-hemolysin-like protein